MDIAIIGAGINGLYLAWKLAEKGHKITVFEKNNKIGNKVCSGLFSSRILEHIPQSAELVEKKINKAILHFPKKDMQIDFKREFLLMDHSKLDKLTAKLAKKSKVKIILNHNISRFPFGFNRIIGCDGYNSIVRQKIAKKALSTRLAIQGFVSYTKKTPNTVETWPTANGFIWKIPRKGRLEYGIIEKPQNAKKLLDNFLANNKIKVKGIGSKFIPQGLIIPKNNSITLCGDAAGLTKPWSGGGVIWGLKAADILIETFPDFSAYRRKMLIFFYPKIIIGKTARNVGVWAGFNMPYLLPKSVKIESDYLL